MKLKVTPSTGNVFRDLGFRREEAEHLLVRADLMIQVQRLIASRRLKQRDAADILRVSQPRVSDLLRGRIDLFSTDALIDMLARLGARVRLNRQGRSSQPQGRITDRACGSRAEPGDANEPSASSHTSLDAG
jgi:predicted XRE-type DNA-binding protein